MNAKNCENGSSKRPCVRTWIIRYWNEHTNTQTFSPDSGFYFQIIPNCDRTVNKKIKNIPLELFVFFIVLIVVP